MENLNKIYKEWRPTILIGAGIFILAFALRLYNLTILPVFGDEAIYIRWAQVMGAEPGLRFLPLSDGKQPLFMWVLMFLVRRFSDPLFIGRLTSVFYGMGTLIGIFALTYYLFKSPPTHKVSAGQARKIALIASLFWAISPYSVFFDRTALVDSMLAMFGVWTLFFAIVTVKTLRLDMAMMAGFTLGGALLTKSPALFFVLMLPVTWMVSRWPKRRFVHLIKLGFLSLVTAAIGYGLYNILRLGPNFHLITSRNQDYVYPISQIWTSPFNPLITNVTSSFNWLWFMGPSILVLFVLIALVSNLKIEYIKTDKKSRSEVALLFIWSAFPLAVSAVYAKVFTARYILFILPTVYIFASIIFLKLYKKKEIVKKGLILGLILYIALALRIDYLLLTDPENANLPRVMRSGYLEEWTSGTGIREVADLIRGEYTLEPDKKIVVGTEGFFGTLPDALQAYLNDLPEITVIGVGVPIREVPIQLIESKQAGNKTYLVVNSTRFLGDGEELGLELAAVYPKAFRPDGSRESLYLFVVTQQALNLKKSP
ncbi:phospholipid carrier-dependent glycosyltransferase [Patescibacteria group bacterium]|nr:phospholipid carrier-dependent glycosyltransferase [Patescibacteria group bacterium]